MHNKPHTKETKQRLSRALKGRKLSDEHRRNIGLAVKRRHEGGETFGFQNGMGYWTGKKRSPETIEKMRVSKRGTYMGLEHWNWKGGITHTRAWIRKLYEYRQWVYAVFKRDNYTCQICNKRGGNLEVDHYPKMFSQILDEYSIATREEARDCDELWDVKNGRTLCEKCHRKTYIGVPKKPWQHERETSIF